MKPKHLVAAIGTLSLLTAVAMWGWPGARESGEPVFSGGSYLTTIKDVGGNVASHSVITLHADHTMLAVDSAQQGPEFYFGTQLGAWKPAGGHRLSGRLINFRYPLNVSGPGIARADYVFNLSPDRRHVSGTITVLAFEMEGAAPFGDDGALVATVTFEGERIEP